MGQTSKRRASEGLRDLLLGIVAGLVAGIWLSLSVVEVASGQADRAAPGVARKEAIVTMHARGTFEVRLTPQAADAEAEDSTLGRLMIDKQFHGDLQATSEARC